jgi:hypothetical protein
MLDALLKAIRLASLIMMIVFFVAVIVYFYSFYNPDFTRSLLDLQRDPDLLYRFITRVLAVGILVLTITIFGYNVIRRTFHFLTEGDVAPMTPSFPQSSARIVEEITSRVDQLLRSFTKSQTDEVGKIIDQRITFLGPEYESERTEAAVKLLAKIDERSIHIFMEELDTKFKSLLISHTEFSLFNEYATSMTKRLTEAVDDLKRRSTVNLLIGMTTTAIAMVGLGFIALTSNLDIANWKDTLTHYVPRLTFVVFIEIFAYFFLRLYKLNLDDVKYYQNEITNMEAKILSCRVAFLMGDKQSMKQVATVLSKTERNFILKKGETTTDLEKFRTEEKSLTNELGKLAGLAKRFSGSSN